LDRLVRLETHSGNQDNRLTDHELKIKQSETKINGLEIKVSGLFAKNIKTENQENGNNKLGSTEILTRSKRPVRLLPTSILFG